MICYDTQPQMWKDTGSLCPVVSITAGGNVQLLTWQLHELLKKNIVMQNGAISVKHRNSVLVLLAASGGKTIKLKCCLAELQNGTIILINMTLCLDTDQRQSNAI